MKKTDYICPLCKSNLILKDSLYICLSKECPHSTEKNAFNIIDSKPIFLSDHLDSVTNKNRKSEYVRRERSFFMPLQRLKTESSRNFLYGNASVTKKNIQLLISFLKELSPNPKLLIIGSGTKGNASGLLYKSKEIEIDGTDIYISDYVDFVSDAHFLPIQNEFYDGVLIQAVLEHVVDPPKVVSEIKRVLKDNGVVYAETPFMQQVHEGAYDFNRYSPLGHRYLFKKFEMIRLGGLGGPEIVLAWSIRYFVWSIVRSRLIGKLFGLIFSVLLRPFSFLISKQSLFDSPSGSFFLGRKKDNFVVSHKELIKLYKGNIS